jgi:peroxiredoxin
MLRIPKILAVVALVVGLVAGLTTSVGCDNNGTTNGDLPNGDVPNGGNPGTEPDLTSGFGVITSAEEYSGTAFQDKDPAPDFTFQDVNGQTLALSDFQGQYVMFNFWRISCHWCVVEMPYIQQVYDNWPDDNLVILTINIGDSADAVADFLEENDLSLPTILDREALLAMQYRVSSLPRTVFVNEEGLIRYIHFGAFQSLEQLEYILEQVMELE